MNKDIKFCQSCGMPLSANVLGTEADGSKNEEYCMYCYMNGKFLQDCTMDEMIEHCAHYKANSKACIYFCDAEGFKGIMLRGTMEVLTDAKSKEMIWCDGDEQYYPGGVTDSNYCVLKFTATDGRFYIDYYPRSFVL